MVVHLAWVSGRVGFSSLGILSGLSLRIMVAFFTDGILAGAGDLGVGNS